MGVTLQTKTKRKATLKLFNHINSFLFEQEYDEMKHFSPAQKKALKDACQALTEVIENG